MNGMSDTVFIILVLIIAFGIVFGIAYLLDSSRKSVNITDSDAPPGPVSRIVLWISYGLIVMTILFVIGAFALNQVFLASLARNSIFLYIIMGIIYRVMKPRGI